MSERLRAANADLIATRGLLAESARDAERVRIARELHDIAGHKLTALKLNLAALVRDARFSEAEPARLCAQLADELLADLRQLVERMRGDEGLDLRAALHALAAPFPRPRAHIEIVGDARVDNLAQAEAVLRAAQEALTNSARRSQAANLWLVLRREPDPCSRHPHDGPQRPVVRNTGPSRTLRQPGRPASAPRHRSNPSAGLAGGSVARRYASRRRRPARAWIAAISSLSIDVGRGGRWRRPARRSAGEAVDVAERHPQRRDGI